MRKYPRDISGMKFGKLTAIKLVRYEKHGEAVWECLCECGNKIDVRRNNLIRGNTKSCGCIPRRSKKLNEYNFDNKYVYSKCSNSDTIFIVDLEDYNKIKGDTWWENDQGYICAIHKHKIVRQHRLIMGVDDDKSVRNIDHINGKRYDNRKENLRFATQAENQINRGANKNSKTGVKGVTKIGNKYYSRITYDGKDITIGIFDNIEDAKIARINKEKELFGEFAYIE